MCTWPMFWVFYRSMHQCYSVAQALVHSVAQEVPVIYLRVCFVLSIEDTKVSMVSWPLHFVKKGTHLFALPLTLIDCVWMCDWLWLIVCKCAIDCKFGKEVQVAISIANFKRRSCTGFLYNVCLHKLCFECCAGMGLLAFCISRHCCGNSVWFIFVVINCIISNTQPYLFFNSAASISWSVQL
jgi:hypothetical protein